WFPQVFFLLRRSGGISTPDSARERDSVQRPARCLLEVSFLPSSRSAERTLWLGDLVEILRANSFWHRWLSRLARRRSAIQHRFITATKAGERGCAQC